MAKRAVIVGASRGLGLALATAYRQQGWAVVATCRSPSAALAAIDGIAVLSVDVTRPNDIAALADTVSDPVDVLLVAAGIGGFSQDAYTLEQLVATNAVGPVRVLDALVGRLASGGVAVAMTSILGSVAENRTGKLDEYRASKAALNSLTRSFAARHPPKDYTLLSLHPGWVRTDMGGPNATLDVATSVNGMMAVIADQAGRGGHRFLDYRGQEIAW